MLLHSAARGASWCAARLNPHDPQTTSEPRAARLPAPRALLVDDEPPHLEAMRALVERQGFETRTAGSLDEARKLLLEASFDLLVTDLQLPDGTSLELLPLLDERPAMDLVLVTGHASVDTAVEALRGGATDYLTKPIEVPRLEKILRNVQPRCGCAGRSARCATSCASSGASAR